MAKKNSSKTATEKAIQSSEPRVLVYKDWVGVNFVDSPLTWEPLETGRRNFRQTDLPKNYFMVQNNLETTDTLGVETRHDSRIIGHAPSGYTFTGVSCVFHRWVFCVAHHTADNYDVILYKDLTLRESHDYWDFTTDNDHMQYRGCIHLNYWNPNTRTGNPSSNTKVTDPYGWEILEIGMYADNLIATCRNNRGGDWNIDGAVFLASVNYNKVNDTMYIRSNDWSNYSGDEPVQIRNGLSSSPKVRNPTVKAVMEVVGSDMSWGERASTGYIPYDKHVAGEETTYTTTGEVQDSHTVRYEVCYCYVNRFGSTLPSPVDTIFTEFSATTWSSARYVNISYGTRSETSKTVQYYDANGTQHQHTVYSYDIATAKDPNIVPGSGITGIDFYARETENVNWVFIGHIDVTPKTNGVKWSFAWLGNMTDIKQWTNSQLNIPTDNDTPGPPASHFAVHDSKLFYWGDPLVPYRLYIGGNPGNEFSTARGLGGAWVDIEPGSGFEVKGTAKWKTVSGANIVTIMCGNSNTNKVKRFNLVETNITITNEISYKGYMYEEVSNVVGCNSRYGYGVFGDGLYSLSRYGLMLTTMAMEYNSQMKNQSVTDVIKPIFTDRLGTRLKDARLVNIDDKIYIALSEDSEQHEETVVHPTNLDQVILVYDMTQKSWYTFTHDQVPAAHGDNDNEKITHIFAIDSDQAQEGLGVITDQALYLYPTTGIQDETTPDFNIILETGELMPKEPLQALSYVQQLEFRFDYLIATPDACEILVEGTDYYGRDFKISKLINSVGGRGYHGKSGEIRNFVEWVRVDKYVESFRIRIKGKARFRLSTINCKFYLQADVIGTQWGFDAHDHGHDSHGTEFEIHHYINDYNNLRRAVIS